jgi:hypothetical protein
MSEQAFRTVKLYWGEADAQGDVRIAAKNQLLLIPRACFEQAEGGSYGPKEKPVSGGSGRYQQAGRRLGSLPRWNRRRENQH